MLLKNSFMRTRIITSLIVVSLSACSWFSSSSDPNAEKPSDIYLQLGIRYMDLDKLELAKENLEKAIEKEPSNAKAHSALAYLYERIEHFDDARKQYEAALALHPDDVSIENNYGKFLCDRREFNKGMAFLKEATSNLLNDRQWIGLTNTGRCLLGMGQRDQAITAFKQALDQNAFYAPALQEMQKISYQLGDYRAAQDYLQQYLSKENHTAETLWIAIQTEHALGNNSLANEYRNLLLEKFPLSYEAKQVSGVHE